MAELLAAAPRLKVLVTSRAALHLLRRARVPGAAAGAARPAAPAAAGRSWRSTRRCALFVERAQAVKPDFAVTNENAPAVAEICHRLDGLPLAIELAAARISLFAPPGAAGPAGAALAGAHRRRARPAGAPADAARRDRLELRPAARGRADCFARLAVFAGGATLEAIAAVCDIDGDLPLDVLDGLERLLDQSLLRQEAGADGEPRFGMLETIREYALERLAERGETEALRRRHAGYFLALAEDGTAAVHRAAAGPWLARLEEEHDNLRARAGLGAGARGEAEIALRLCLAVWRFWWWRGHMGEGLRWGEAALAQGAGASEALRIGIAGVLSHFYWLQGRFERVIALDEEDLCLARAAGVGWVLGGMLFRAALGASERGDVARAREVLAEGLIVARTSDDPLDPPRCCWATASWRATTATTSGRSPIWATAWRKASRWAIRRGWPPRWRISAWWPCSATIPRGRGRCSPRACR